MLRWLDHLLSADMFDFLLTNQSFKLLFYTPSATLVRLCAINALIALATS